MCVCGAGGSSGPLLQLREPATQFRVLRFQLGDSFSETLLLVHDGHTLTKTHGRRNLNGLTVTDVQRHELVSEDRIASTFTTELTRLQRKILRLLGIPKAYTS